MMATETATEEITDVIFRVWRANKGGEDVIALMPYLPADVLNRYCTSYMHIGQHGSADYHGVMCETRAATEAEAAPLRRELEQIGYKLRVMRRASWRRMRRRD